MSSAARMMGPARRAARLLSPSRASGVDLEGMGLTCVATAGHEKSWESQRELHSAVSPRPPYLFQALAQPSRQLNVHEYQVRWSLLHTQRAVPTMRAVRRPLPQGRQC